MSKKLENCRKPGINRQKYQKDVKNEGKRVKNSQKFRKYGKTVENREKTV